MIIGAYATGTTEASSTCARNIHWLCSGCAVPSNKRVSMDCWEDDILHRAFNFDIELVQGAGAFVAVKKPL